MTPVAQTVFGPEGNCFTACLASIFDLTIEQVPYFFTGRSISDEDWWDGVKRWLSGRGWGIINLSSEPEYLAKVKGLYIVTYKIKGGTYHATVWQDGKLLHDPHPDKIAETDQAEMDSVDFIYPLNPATFLYMGAA